MITLKEYPNKTFATQKEAFLFLKQNEKTIIQLKCSEVMKSIDKGQPKITTFFEPKSDTSKALDFVKEDNFYPVINTTKWLDNHLDVHMDGIWDRSIDHNKNKIYYVDSHSLKTSDVIAWPDSVNVMTKMVLWSDLGKDIEGETQALIFEIPKADIEHEGAKKIISKKRNTENSVRMQYVKVRLAINSDEKDLKENKAIWDEVYSKIANKETAAEYGYFWAVYEAKIFKEGSMVLAGSNEMTPIIYDKKNSTVIDTESQELGNTTSDKVASFYKNLY